MSGKRRVHVGYFHIDEEAREAVNKVLDNGRISEGRMVREFEKKWAEYIGTKHCIATSSGWGALVSALTAIKYFKDLKDGMKIITAPLTYIADTSAISTTGFKPVFVDIDPVTFSITPEAIKVHLEEAQDIENYAMILPVDLMGYSVRIDEINKIAGKYSLPVLEDAAQAHGTIYRNKKAGSQADAGIFSFYIAHNIQAGEMGAVVTNNAEINRLVRKIKAQGRACECLVCTRDKGICPPMQNYKGSEDFDPRFTHDLIGFNFKTMEFQAALALPQLARVSEIIKKRQENVKYLNRHLAKFSDILDLPHYCEEVSYLAYPLVIKDTKVISRKRLRFELKNKGIESRPIFGCIPTQQSAYDYLRETYDGKLPNAERIGTNGFYIGCHQYLVQDDLEYIIEVFNEILG